MFQILMVGVAGVHGVAAQEPVRMALSIAHENAATIEIVVLFARVIPHKPKPVTHSSVHVSGHEQYWHNINLISNSLT